MAFVSLMDISIPGRAFLYRQETGRAMPRHLRIAQDRFEPYQDESGQWHIGFGHLLTDSELLAIRAAGSVSGAYVIKLWFLDTAEAVRTVNGCLERRVEQNEFDALVSFAYNVGKRAFCRSTIIEMINRRAPRSKIEDEWRRWVFVDGERSRGLAKRREAEIGLFFSEEDDGSSTDGADVSGRQRGAPEHGSTWGAGAGLAGATKGSAANQDHSRRRGRRRPARDSRAARKARRGKRSKGR